MTSSESGMARRLPPLVALRAFEASARLGSHRRAAEELCVDHTVISKHIRKLEQDVGTQLMTTGPTGTQLTAPGAEYFQRISEALGVIATATQRLRERSACPTLHVACSPGFAVRWLVPRISLFLESSPRLEIAVRPTNRAPRLRAGEADVDLRYTPHCAAGDQQLELGIPRVFPVASPAWLARHPPLTRLEDLLRATLVHEETHAHWQTWLRAVGVDVSDIPHGPRYWNAALALDAARMGHGIALANDYIAQDELATGQLVEVFATEVRLYPYLFMTNAERWSEPVITAFRDWLVAQMVPHGRQTLTYTCPT